MIYSTFLDGAELQFFRYNEFDLWFVRKRVKKFTQWKPTDLTDYDFFVEYGILYFSQKRLVLTRIFANPYEFKYLGKYRYLFSKDVYFAIFETCFE